MAHFKVSIDNSPKPNLSLLQGNVLDSLLHFIIFTGEVILEEEQSSFVFFIIVIFSTKWCIFFFFFFFFIIVSLYRFLCI